MSSIARLQPSLPIKKERRVDTTKLAFRVAAAGAVAVAVSWFGEPANTSALGPNFSAPTLDPIADAPVASASAFPSATVVVGGVTAVAFSTIVVFGIINSRRTNADVMGWKPDPLADTPV